MISERPKEFYSISLLSSSPLSEFWKFLVDSSIKIKQLGGPILTNGQLIKSGQWSKNSNQYSRFLWMGQRSPDEIESGHVRPWAMDCPCLALGNGHYNLYKRTFKIMSSSQIPNFLVSLRNAFQSAACFKIMSFLGQFWLTHLACILIMPE